ncbi:J domain-containing protein [Geothrix terrae]|uniref:J domain-containing protein n=1 Tax=Geothrix terrae TaxID=2922720 RepID=UPI001FACF72A|nr:J domain-containing protein [Geothrix terrae]
MNPFDVLEIPSDASPEDIKAAYHRLAKQWHPDRYTGAEKVEAEARFRELAEAFSTLKDPGKRLAMMQQLPKTPVAAPTPPGKEKDAEAASERTAEDWAALAKEAFEGGRVDQAQALIQYAIRMDGKKPQYHALLATILEQSGGDLRTVVKALEAAVRLAPRDVDSHLRLAAHFQTLGMVARAQRHLQTAREIAPNHPKLRQTAFKGGKGAAGAAGQKGKVQTAPAGQPGLVDQLKDLWGRLTGKG